jgi:hypothetical protein
MLFGTGFISIFRDNPERKKRAFRAFTLGARGRGGIKWRQITRSLMERNKKLDLTKFQRAVDRTSCDSRQQRRARAFRQCFEDVTRMWDIPRKARRRTARIKAKEILRSNV